MTRVAALLLVLGLATACRGEGTEGPRVLGAEEGAVVRVEAGETRTLRDQVIRAAPEGPAVVVRGVLEASHLSVEGGDPAFLVEAGGHLVLEDVRIHGATAGLRVVGGEAEVRRLRVEQPREEGLLVSGGALTLEDVSVTGGEYGLLARNDARLQVRGLSVAGPRFAGVGLSASQGQLAGLRLVGGRHGGLLANDLSGPLNLEGLEVREVTGVGLQLLRGRLSLADARISRVGLDATGGGGDALLLDDVTATLADLSVVSAAGAALVAHGGRVSVAGLVVAGCGGAAVQGWREAQLSLAGLAVDRCAGPGLLASEGAALVASSGVAPDLAVRCEDGGRVELPERLVLRGAPECVHPLSQAAAEPPSDAP